MILCFVVYKAFSVSKFQLENCFKRLAELMSFPKFDEEETESKSGLVACLRPQEPNKWCGEKKKKDSNSEFLTLEFTCQMAWL